MQITTPKLKNKNIILVGIGAIARVGKDTLADILLEIASDKGIAAKKFPLAHALKLDLDDFLSEKCNMDVWTNDSNEKAIFRDLLVAYGKIQRFRTDGTYWTNIVTTLIDDWVSRCCDSEPALAIVPDVRYAVYDTDEVNWVKNNSGILINLERQVVTHGKVEHIEPANTDEAINCTKVKKVCNIQYCWDTVEDMATLKEEVKTHIWPRIDAYLDIL
jgi:hypothetical protein